MLMVLPPCECPISFTRVNRQPSVGEQDCKESNLFVFLCDQFTVKLTNNVMHHTQSVLLQHVYHKNGLKL